MVSTGDTEISLHIRSPRTPELNKFQFLGGGYSGVKYSKCQDLPKFQFWGGYSGVKYSGVKYSKCQDLPKFQFFFGGGGTLESSTQSAKICLNFNLGEGGTLVSNTQSAKICLNFNFQGGILRSQFQRGALWRIWTKIYCLSSVYRNLLVHHR